MTKGTSSRASLAAFVLLALGCGGRAENQVSNGVSGAEAASGAPSVEVGGAAGADAGGSPPCVSPIDTTGLPTELPMNCVGPVSPPRLLLPCKVGTGAINIIECYDPGGATALTTAAFSSTLCPLLNQPVEIPSASFPPVPTYGEVTVDGVGYRGVLQGTAVFSQLDGRAFVATLTGGRIAWTGISDQTLTFTCTIPDTLFWGVAGNFQ